MFQRQWGALMDKRRGIWRTVYSDDVWIRGVQSTWPAFAASSPLTADVLDHGWRSTWPGSSRRGRGDSTGYTHPRPSAQIKRVHVGEFVPQLREASHLSTPRNYGCGSGDINFENVIFKRMNGDDFVHSVTGSCYGRHCDADDTRSVYIRWCTRQSNARLRKIGQFEIHIRSWPGKMDLWPFFPRGPPTRNEVTIGGTYDRAIVLRSLGKGTIKITTRNWKWRHIYLFYSARRRNRRVSQKRNFSCL
mgnify:CR=1 FL=1